MKMESTADIIRASAIIINDKYEILLSRNVGSKNWHTLGGKIEQNENSVQTLIRELREELDIRIEITEEIYAISSVFPAANKPGKTVLIYYHFCKMLDKPKLIENVEEIRWFSKSDLESGKYEFAESTRNFLLPKLIADNRIL